MCISIASCCRVFPYIGGISLATDVASKALPVLSISSRLTSSRVEVAVSALAPLYGLCEGSAVLAVFLISAVVMVVPVMVFDLILVQGWVSSSSIRVLVPVSLVVPAPFTPHPVRDVVVSRVFWLGPWLCQTNVWVEFPVLWFWS